MKSYLRIKLILLKKFIKIDNLMLHNKIIKLIKINIKNNNYIYLIKMILKNSNKMKENKLILTIFKVNKFKIY